ncbi:AAA family ATPase [Leptolyngbya iicbica]|uniref:MoxR family ATPase n=2 Tax=Cyanophyceae TaxID=3028117 RepID=A0A4Q7E9L1_9CYAN|nr:MoxR family ATPase [Leptolyngbya sp. LK]RZM79547.1 MoxR family ATPase [Leptolyngbya sp. LK]
MSDWKVYKNDRATSSEWQLPPPPSWRTFTKPDSAAESQPAHRGALFYAEEEEINMVNAALYLRRPLLVTGNPGTGKTSLAYSVAYELDLGEVLYWPITTRTTLKDGLYNYDAVGRLQDAKLNPDDSLNRIGKYITLGPLGTALLPSERPRVLLIDEIDKSDVDLPNDLLHVFENGEYTIPELTRIATTQPTVTVQTAYSSADVADEESAAYAEVTKGRVRCTNFPFIILTSNGERDFPPAFLRRCLRLDMAEPQEPRLRRIVAAHLGEADADEVTKRLKAFLAQRTAGEMATDQLLNAIYLVSQGQLSPQGTDREALVKAILKRLDSRDGV